MQVKVIQTSGPVGALCDQANAEPESVGTGGRIDAQNTPLQASGWWCDAMRVW